MDFHKYLQQEFGVDLNKRDKKLSTKELEYYTTLSQKFYEENFLLIISSILLGSFTLISFFLVVYQSNVPVVSGRISTLSLSISCVLIFSSTIYSLIAHSLFTHFQMISRDVVVNSERILSAINNAYVYKQIAKTLLAFAIIALIVTVALALSADLRMLTAFFVCIVPISILIRHYIKIVHTSAKERTMSNLRPIIDADNPSLFSEIAVRTNITPSEKDRALSSLVSIIGNPSPRVRSQAIKFLAKRATSEAIDLIINMLGDKDAEVRAQAAVALGKFGERSTKEALKSLLYDENAIVRRSAVESLGKLRVGSATTMLIALLEDSSPEVRGSAAEALGYIKKPKAIEKIVEKLDDADWFVRYKAVISLSRFAGILSEEMIRKVISLTNDENEYVVSSTKNTLNKILPQVDSAKQIYVDIEQVLTEETEEEDAGQENNEQQENENIEADLEKDEDELMLEEDLDIDDMENW